MPKSLGKLATIDEICKGLRILEKYKCDLHPIGCRRKNCCLFLQGKEFKDVTEDDINKLIDLNWAPRGPFEWYI